MADDQARRPRGPRGNYAKTAARRQAIIDAATEVFGESGYRAGSMREIADRCGLSEAGLLHHFPTKAVLLENVLSLGGELDAHIRDHPPESGILLLRGMVALARRNVAVPGRMEMITTLIAEAQRPDHPAHQYFRDRLRMIADHFGIAFARIAADGLLRDDLTAEQAARIAMSAMLGLERLATAEWADFDHADELRRTFGLLLKSGTLPD
ncbi:TetR/AcrR family transcriptional regulator [Kutzneria sp. NPDC052558]|uniref:TetR/AcrR family transcriptional regulator n=1 Tax=Kutzneria sp. NPDC052558 TaxID=3364121 RepID=UPI0037CB5F62